MSLPNHLTISRFWMTAVLMICMSIDFPYARIAALVIFLVASITDALDGYLARNFYGCTSFGKLMDPLADKVLVCAAFIGFVELDVMQSVPNHVHGIIVVQMVGADLRVCPNLRIENERKTQVGLRIASL